MLNINPMAGVRLIVKGLMPLLSFRVATVGVAIMFPLSRSIRIVATKAVRELTPNGVVQLKLGYMDTICSAQVFH